MKKQILETLRARLASEEADLARHVLIADSLAKWEGKKLTKRAQSDLPEGVTMYDDYGGYQFRAGNYTGYDGKTYTKTHYVRTASDGLYSRQSFDESDSPNFRGAQERAEKLRRILENPAPFVDALANLHKAFQTMRKAAALVETTGDSYHNPAYYELLHLLGVPSDLMTGFRYGFKK